MCVWNCRKGSLGHPLVGTGGTFRELPFVAEQMLKKPVAPLRRRGRPSDFQSAGNSVSAFSGAEAILPAEALLLESASFRFRRDMRCRGGTVGFAERVTTGD